MPMLQNFARHIQFPIILERGRSQNKQKKAQITDSAYYYITISIIDWFTQL
jgi:hypothetical protein